MAGTGLGGVRLDSGDLLALAGEVRAQLDGLGATGTRITVTSDLDEHAIAALAVGPVDAYGVGTSLVTGSGAPTAGLVYKLVAREDDDGTMRSVAKASKDKVSVGGRKWALRRRDAGGTATEEVIGIGRPPADDGDDRALLVPLVVDGEVVAEHVGPGRRHRGRRAAPRQPGRAAPQGAPARSAARPRSPPATSRRCR